MAQKLMEKLMAQKIVIMMAQKKLGGQRQSINGHGEREMMRPRSIFFGLGTRKIDLGLSGMAMG